jgi:PAS domain S-box-containing protein
MIEGVGIVDAAGNIVHLNPAARSLLGICGSREIPKHIYELLDLVDFARSSGRGLSHEECPLLRSARGETISHLEMTIRIRATGESKIISYCSAPIRDERDAVTHAVINLHDISGRKRAELSLAQSEQQLRVILENAELGTWTYDPVRRTFTASARTKAMHGLDPEARMNSDDLLAAIYADDRDTFSILFAGQPEEGQPLRAEVRTVWPDQSVHWVAYAGRYVGEPPCGTGQWLGVVRDITLAKHAEDEMTRSERCFRAVAAAVPDVLMSTPGDGTCDYINLRGAEYTGLPINALLGAGWQTVLHPEDRERLEPAVFDAMSGEHSFLQEARIRMATGVYCWFRIHFVPVREADGSVRKWIGAATNVDDLKRLGEQLQRKTRELEALNTRLRESNLDLEQFAATIAHDLQSPLNAIALCCEEVTQVSAARPDAVYLEPFDFIASCVTRMRTLIHSVLDYALMEPTGPVALEKVDCGAVLARTLRVLSSEIRTTDSVVTFDPLPTIQANAAHVEQVFENLISNAIKYRKPNTPARIHVSAVSREDAWEFSVSDNGIGLEGADPSRIFRLFERIKPRPGQEGFGIGLAICQRAIERHGGRIWVRSEPGQGSTFFFTIPSGGRALHFGNSAMRPLKGLPRLAG